jgi:transcriptional regulator of acetoin/glycerol metabolism
LLADNGRITVRELPPEVLLKSDAPNVSVSFGSPQQQQGVSSFQNPSSSGLRESEKQQIINALERTGWHRGKTAEILGISPSTLYRRLREYDLEIV